MSESELHGGREEEKLASVHKSWWVGGEDSQPRQKMSRVERKG